LGAEPPAGTCSCQSCAATWRIQTRCDSAFCQITFKLLIRSHAQILSQLSKLPVSVIGFSLECCMSSIGPWPSSDPSASTCRPASTLSSHLFPMYSLTVYTSELLLNCSEFLTSFSDSFSELCDHCMVTYSAYFDLF